MLERLALHRDQVLEALQRVVPGGERAGK